MIPITAVSGTIATLDTTTLANGSYWINLLATNTSGNLETSLVLVTVTCGYHPGRVTATVTDLVVPATGLAINIERTYDSLNANTSSDFGYGWSLGYNVNLVVDPAGDVTFTLGGQRKTFYFTPQVPACSPLIGCAFGWAITPGYTPEPGLHGTLTGSGDGCGSGGWDFLAQNGSSWICQTGVPYTPSSYVYTDPNGTSYTISATGNLTSIQDLNGNGLTITPNGITSTTGLSVKIVRDPNNNNHITQIVNLQDNPNSTYIYGYDSIGNLNSVTYPATTQAATCASLQGSSTMLPNTSQYTYDAKDGFPHLLNGGKDAVCNVLPSSTYDPATGRLANTTNMDGKTSYQYSLGVASTINGASVPNTNVTTITNPPDSNNYASTTELIYDSYGDLLQSTIDKSGLALVTVNTYDQAFDNQCNPVAGTVLPVKHNLTSVTDPLGHTSCYTYDTNGNKTSSTYPSLGVGHNTTSYTQYNQFSEPTQTIDENGNTRAFNYDANYNPQSVTDSIGTLTSFLFNPDGTLQAGAIGYDISLQPAYASTFGYDSYGNMISRTDPLGNTTSYQYNSLGQKIWMQAPTPTMRAGSPTLQTQYFYDALGNPVETVTPQNATPTTPSLCSSNYTPITSGGTFASICATYDANGNKTSSTDADGNVTGYRYDALNRLIETDYPDGNKSSINQYDFRNNIVQETDQNGHVTQHVYDTAGRQTSVTRGLCPSNSTGTACTPAPTTISNTYYNDGRLETETDAKGSLTYYTYDAGGRQISVTHGYVAGTAINCASTPPPGAVCYGYDDHGNRTSSTDANGYVTSFHYDARNRLKETDYPDGTSVVNTYDGPGNLISVVDQAKNEVAYTYYPDNKLETVIQKDSPSTSNNTNYYSYDYLANLIGLTDANLHITAKSFDLFLNPVAKTYPDNQKTETRSYDPAGNLAKLIDFNGHATTYAYTLLNQLKQITPDPSFTNEKPVTFTYTPTGKYLSSTAADGTVNYQYDAQDRLWIKATPEGTLTYTYPEQNQMRIESSNAHGANVLYTWDAASRLEYVQDNNLPSGSNTTTYNYDPAGNVHTVSYPNGLTSTFAYDPLNRLTGLIANTNPPTSYSYSPALGTPGGKIAATESTGRTIQWSFAGIYRLNNETVAGDPDKIDGSASYTLDPVGNRTAATSSLPGISPISGTYNTDDQLSTETYDANGNVLTTGGKTFTYDSQNRVATMTEGGTTVTYVYDAFGNRVAKTVNGVTTQYLVEDDVNPTGLPQVLEEIVNGAVTRTYTYGLQRISENQVLNGVWTPSFYQYDGMDDVRQLTNSSGAVTDSYEYDAFGNLLAKTGSTPNNYLYRGEQYDSDLGMYYLRARYYNPLTGRFMSRDPKEYKPLRPDQQLFDAEVQPIDVMKLHTYLYAAADPVNRIDPMGREEELEDAMDNLESIEEFQLKVRQGRVTNRIIDCIQKSYDRVDNILEDIVRGKLDPGGY